MQMLASQKNRVIGKLYNNITKLLFDPDVTGTEFRDKMLLRCQEYYRTHIFSPQNILKLMDLNGGQLSMTAVGRRTLTFVRNRYQIQSTNYFPFNDNNTSGINNSR